MKCYGVAKSGKTIAYDDSFTIHIPYGAVYCIKKTEDDGDTTEALYIKMLDEIPNNYREGLFSIPKLSKGHEIKITLLERLDEGKMAGLLENRNSILDTPDSYNRKLLHKDEEGFVVRVNQFSEYIGTQICAYRAIIIYNQAVYFVTGDVLYFDSALNNGPADGILSSVRSFSQTSGLQSIKYQETDMIPEDSDEYEKAPMPELVRNINLSVPTFLETISQALEEDSDSEFNLAGFFVKGYQVDRDIRKAVYWLERAQEHGYEDYSKTIKLYRNIIPVIDKAENGDAEAQCELAKFYLKLSSSFLVLGEEKDLKESYEWARKSAEQGNTEGMYILALCYEHGRGVLADPEKSLELYKQASDLGHAPSMHNYGVQLLNKGNYDYDQNLMTEGLTLIYKAAMQGYDLSIQQLYVQGKSVKQVIETYKEKGGIALEGLMDKARTERCESLKAGTELTYKKVKITEHDNYNLEFFYHDGSVGLLPYSMYKDIAPLLELDLVTFKVYVKECTPKSKRGSRARKADLSVYFEMEDKGKIPEYTMPEPKFDPDEFFDFEDDIDEDDYEYDDNLDFDNMTEEEFDAKCEELLKQLEELEKMLEIEDDEEDSSNNLFSGDSDEELLERIKRMEQVAEDQPFNSKLFYELGIEYVNEIDGKFISVRKAVENFKKAADMGDDLAEFQYELWNSLLKLKAGIEVKEEDFQNEASKSLFTDPGYQMTLPEMISQVKDGELPLIE